jgi:hypothetical protein
MNRRSVLRYSRQYPIRGRVLIQRGAGQDLRTVRTRFILMHYRGVLLS